jgi:quercetin dioxygenase-like cupin family protein
MGAIFRINEGDMPWFEYEPQIRVKALTRDHPGAPSTQYIEYGAGYTDPMHSHETDEVFVVVEGELWLEGLERSSGPGSIVFIPRDTEYAVRAGPEGVRYFRIVVS